MPGHVDLLGVRGEPVGLRHGNLGERPVNVLQQDTFGWYTIFTQTNVSATVFQVEANRTAGASLITTYCRPNCSDPTASANLSVQMWVHEVAFANLTSAGSVSTPSGPEPALALLNSSVQVQGNFSQVVHEVIPPAARSTTGTPRTFYSALFVSSTGSAALTFAPALGLFPESLTAGSWNSTSAYRASGAWSMSDEFTQTSFAGVTRTIHGTNPGRVSSGAGTVTLRGSTMSSLQLKGGTATTATQLEVGGPFVLWDGLILVPAGAELLQPPAAGASSTAAPPWSADEAGWETVSTSAVDIGRSSPTGHVPILASSTAYEPTSSDSGNEAMNYTTTALTPDDGPGTLVVQGQPIAVSQGTDPHVHRPGLLILLPDVPVALAGRPRARHRPGRGRRGRRGGRRGPPASAPPGAVAERADLPARGSTRSTSPSAQPGPPGGPNRTPRRPLVGPGSSEAHRYGKSRGDRRGQSGPAGCA